MIPQSAGCSPYTHSSPQSEYTPQPDRSAPLVSDEHRRMLEEGSAISPEVLAESGARTIWRGRELPYEFSERQRRRAPGVLFVTHRPNGSTSFCFRPNKPDPGSPGHKYEQPCKARGAPGNVLDVLPSQHHLIHDTSVPVVFVEGTKKMLSLVSAAREAGAALLVVAVTACWNWMADGKPIPDLLDIPLEGRRATVMYDSDMLRKPEVQGGAKGLAEYLKGRGAEVYITYFEDAQDGSKVGADDFFVAGGTFVELRMLTRRYDPQDFALVRLSRDERLASMISDLAGSFWATERKGMGGHTDRDVALVLIRTAAETGKPVEGGVFVPKSWADLQTEVKVGPRTVSKSIARLEERGFILERVKGSKPDKRGGFVLSAGVYQVGTEQGIEQNVTLALHSLYASTIHPRTPRLMWSSPGSRPRRGRVKGTRKVRQSPPPKPKAAVKRPGKIRGAILDVLDAAGGAIDVDVLGDVMHRSRPRELFRRKRPGSKGRDGLAIWLIDAGIISYDGKTITRAADWLRRVDDLRREGREIDSRVVLARPDGSTEEHVVEGDETIARRRLEIKRKAYHRRHRVKPDEHYANAGADGYMEDLESVGDPDPTPEPEGTPEVSPLAAVVRAYLDKRPSTVRKHGRALPGWLANTFWAYELVAGKPTPEEVRAAIDELGGERYLRELLEASAETREPDAGAVA